MATKKTPPAKKPAPAKAEAPKTPAPKPAAKKQGPDVTRDEIDQAAADLNNVLQLEPALELKDVSDEDAMEQIRTAGNLAAPEDELSAATWAVMEKLGCEVKRAEPKAPAEKKAPATPAGPKAPRDPFENPSAVTRIMMCVVDNPDATVEDIRNYLAANGKTATDATITMIAADTRKTVRYIKSKG